MSAFPEQPVIDEAGVWETFVATYPGLAGGVDAYRSEWLRDVDESSDKLLPPGLYSLFDEVIDPVVLKPLLEAEQEDGPGLRQFFDLVERWATRGDESVKTFVKVGVCERIGDDPGWLARARRYMGPATMKASLAAEVGLGRMWE